MRLTGRRATGQTHHARSSCHSGSGRVRVAGAGRPGLPKCGRALNEDVLQALGDQQEQVIRGDSGHAGEVLRADDHSGEPILVDVADPVARGAEPHGYRPPARQVAKYGVDRPGKVVGDVGSAGQGLPQPSHGPASVVAAGPGQSRW